MGIGSSSALEIPGGGTEGYHVLKVIFQIKIQKANKYSIKLV